MRNKNYHVASQSKGRIIVGKESITEIMAMKQEIDRLKEKISELQLADKMKWNNSAVEVIFKNEGFAKKYKTSVENFLTNLLDGEPFLVDFRISKIPEPEHLIEPNDSFCIDRLHTDSSKNGHSPQVKPTYITSFEEVLNFEEPKENLEEKGEPDEKGQVQVVTCFNCLGNHHMKNCPEELDRLRISENRKDYQSNSSRYHEEEQLHSSMKPGCISNSLQEALGLKPYEIPFYIYHMRVIGYPPGWMNEAVFETSGLSLYDSEGKAVDDDSSLSSSREPVAVASPCSSDTEPKYDGRKFVNYPGFNTPVPNGFRDEWQDLRMPPIQPHQQLIKALKSPSTINGVNIYKRKSSNFCNGELKKSKDVPPQDLNHSRTNWRPIQESTPRHSSTSNNHHQYRTPPRSATPINKSPSNRKSCSLSMSPGTPILDTGNCFKRLPDSGKFAEGISEHLPFENLPDAVGTFEKMRGVLSTLHEKQKLGFASDHS